MLEEFLLSQKDPVLLSDLTPLDPSPSLFLIQKSFLRTRTFDWRPSLRLNRHPETSLQLPFHDTIHVLVSEIRHMVLFPASMLLLRARTQLFCPLLKPLLEQCLWEPPHCCQRVVKQLILLRIVLAVRLGRIKQLEVRSLRPLFPGLPLGWRPFLVQSRHLCRLSAHVAGASDSKSKATQARSRRHVNPQLAAICSSLDLHTSFAHPDLSIYFIPSPIFSEKDMSDSSNEKTVTSVVMPDVPSITASVLRKTNANIHL